MSQIGEAVARPAVVGSLPALGLSALGVVFGDIGTSPLYTLKTVLGMTDGTPEPAAVLGVLSLVIPSSSSVPWQPSLPASTFRIRRCSLGSELDMWFIWSTATRRLRIKDYCG